MAAKKVDIIKFWVDDRDHTVTKLSPELYRAGIDEAHKKGLRTNRAALRARWTGGKSR